MPQYAVIGSHPPGDCPISSKGAREWAQKMIPQMETLAAQHGIKFLLPWMHLDPAHKGLLLVEAPSAETVRDFLVKGGLFHFLDNEFFMLTPIAELLKQAQNFPTVYP